MKASLREVEIESILGVGLNPGAERQAELQPVTRKTRLSEIWQVLMNANERERDRDKTQEELKKRWGTGWSHASVSWFLNEGHAYLQTRFPRELPEKRSKYGARDLGKVRVHRVRGATVSPHADLTLC